MCHGLLDLAREVSITQPNPDKCVITALCREKVGYAVEFFLRFSVLSGCCFLCQQSITCFYLACYLYNLKRFKYYEVKVSFRSILFYIIVK